MEARRELFVLSAQVQAALGEGVPGAPQLGPPAVAHDDDRGTAEDDLAAFAQEEWGFAPRSTVVAVLDEARADMAVLDRDARAVPSRSVAASDAPVPPVDEEPGGEARRAPATSIAAASPLLTPSSTHGSEDGQGTSIRLFIAASVLAGLAVVLGTVWMLRGPDSGAADAPPSDAAAVATPSAPAAAQAGPAAAGATTSPTSVTVSIEAVRPAWVRAIVDGRPDAGQTLRAGQTTEFSGRSIALRIGDAGAVLVSVNGSEAVTLGRDGQVVNREFTPDAPPPASAPPPAVDPAPTTGTPQASSGGATTSASDVPPLPATAGPLLSPAIAPTPVAGTSSVGAGALSIPTLERTSSPAPSPESVLVAAAQRWLDAYQRQDQSILGALSTSNLVVTDERPTGERMPLAAGGIARTLDRVTVRLAADTAVLTGVMTERAVEGGLQRSSPVSLLWISSAGTWRLSQARLVSQSTLSQIFR
jgi:hypothetical protein